jgi:hypothetical protein
MTKTNYDPLPKSEKLTALKENLRKFKTKAAQSRAEVWRLTKVQSPQIHDATVTRFTDPAPLQKAYIGIKKPLGQGVVSTGISEQEIAASNEDILKRTLAGESFTDSTSTKEKLENEHRQWAAYESAIEHLNREIERERTVLAIQYSKQLKATHDDLVKKVCEPMLELHAAWTELNNLKRHLIDSEIGLHGLCLTMPDFLSTPNNPHSEMADFLRAAKRERYIKEIPVEYRI